MKARVRSRSAFTYFSELATILNAAGMPPEAHVHLPVEEALHLAPFVARKPEASRDKGGPDRDNRKVTVSQKGRRKYDLTRNTRAPHFTPQHWLLCHMGLY